MTFFPLFLKKLNTFITNLLKIDGLRLVGLTDCIRKFEAQQQSDAVEPNEDENGKKIQGCFPVRVGESREQCPCKWMLGAQIKTIVVA